MKETYGLTNALVDNPAIIPLPNSDILVHPNDR